MDMNLLKYSAFVATVEDGSFTAQQNSCITHSPASAG